MLNPSHLPLPTCPHLPEAPQPLTAACVAALQNNRGPEFYEMSLRYGQSLWLQGFPAQALLQVNRALGAEVAPEAAVLRQWPLPYAAAAWLLTHRQAEQFIGNPRRHYQHLATRMVEPRKEMRTWRAWACWWIARLLLPDMPADEEQLAAEGVAEPKPEEIFAELTRLGHPGEAEAWQELILTLGK